MNKGKNSLGYLTQKMSKEQQHYLKKFQELLIKQNKKSCKHTKATN